MNYAIQEMFHSFQGEGVHLGCSAFFVRLMGCDQCCEFCDSAATWHRNWKPAEAMSFNELQLVEKIREGMKSAHPGTFVVLTGGEPALYDLQPLVNRLSSFNLRVHIETAGHKRLPAGLNWRTVSPKFFATPPFWENMQSANEIKLICTSPEQMREDLARTRELIDQRFPPQIWLHPEWSQRENVDLLQAIVETVKREMGVRAGYQVHKLYRADLFDPGADKRIVPLGGIS